MSRIPFLTAEQLSQQAAAAAGLSDFGTDFQEGLGVLIDAINRDIHVNERNIQQLSGPIIGLLISRLYSEAGWKKRPDRLGKPLPAPIVVTGIPRTGTTALHKLLSLDPQFQGLEQWLIQTPMPRPPREKWREVPEFRTAVEQQELFLAAVPEMRVTHEVNADEVDECLNLLAQSFVSHYLATGLGLPSYDRWWWQQNEMPSYRRFSDNLRLLGANEPDKRWLLKNPGHIAHLDALLAVFPDACVIQTHRDPVKSIPSVCSLIQPARRFFHAADVDTAALGARELEFWARSAERAEAVRQKHPNRFHDVRFADFQRQPIAVVEAIYRHFGLELDDATRSTMVAWLAANPQHKHGRHDYTPEQFGLSEATIRERFADYISRHQLAEPAKEKP